MAAVFAGVVSWHFRPASPVVVAPMPAPTAAPTATRQPAPDPEGSRWLTYEVAPDLGDFAIGLVPPPAPTSQPAAETAAPVNQRALSRASLLAVEPSHDTGARLRPDGSRTNGWNEFLTRWVDPRFTVADGLSFFNPDASWTEDPRILPVRRPGGLSAGLKYRWSF